MKNLKNIVRNAISNKTGFAVQQSGGHDKNLEHVSSVLKTKIAKLSDAFSYIGNNIRDKYVLHQVRNLYVVGLIAYFETFWRDLIFHLVETYKLEYSDIEKLLTGKSKKEDLEDIFVKKRLSYASLVANSDFFYSLDVINQIMSSLLKCDFLSDYAKHTISILKGGKEEKMGVGRFFSMAILNKAFNIRHDMVHNSGEGHDLEEEDIRKIEISIQNFCCFSTWFISGKLKQT